MARQLVFSCILATALLGAQAALKDCVDTYDASEQGCKDLGELALCISDNVDNEDTRVYDVFLATAQKDKPKCAGFNEMRDPSIRAEQGNIVLNSGEKDVIFHRYRRETVSLWGLADLISGNEAALEKLTSDTSDMETTLQGSIDATKTECKADLDTYKLSVDKSIEDLEKNISETREMLMKVIGEQCVWPYEYQKDGDCMPLTVCKSTQYISKPPTTSTDRECAPIDECEDDEFEVTAPTPSSNRKCQKVDACGNGKFEVTAPTKFSNRVCKAPTTCSKAQIEVAPPTTVSDRRCLDITWATCKEVQAAWPEAPDGLYQTKQGNAYLLAYCLMTRGGGGWTLVMRISRWDGNINFYHNGPGYSATNYGGEAVLRELGRGAQSYRDYISPLYNIIKAKDIRIARELQSDRFSIWSENGCLEGTTLRSILAPGTKSCNGFKCCQNIKYGVGSPFHNGYFTLLLNGDECSDTEPAKMAIRTSCTGDAEILQLGYTRGGHGNHEVWSQGDKWPELDSVVVFVKE